MDWRFVLPDGFLGVGCGLLTLAPALIKDAKKERTEFDFDKQVQCIVGMLVVFAILLESHKFIENIYFKNVRVILIMVFVMQLVYRGGWCYDYLKEKRALTIKDVSMVSSAFQAEVTEIGSGRLFVKNIFIKVVPVFVSDITGRGSGRSFDSKKNLEKQRGSRERCDFVFGSSAVKRI